MREGVLRVEMGWDELWSRWREIVAKPGVGGKTRRDGMRRDDMGCDEMRSDEVGSDGMG